MDPRDRADAALARARARGANVVTPDDAVSPMDAASTQQIPRAVVAALDTGTDQGDSTMVIPAAIASGLDDRTQPRGHPQARPPAPQQARPPAPQHVQPPQRPGQQQTYPPRPPVPAPVPVNGQLPQQPRPARSAEEETPEPRDLGGLVPTVQQPGAQRSLMSRRLDGQ